MAAVHEYEYKNIEEAWFHAKPTPKSWWKLPVQVFGLTTVWWVSACAIILTIKDTVSGLYPYPFAFTSITQPSTALLAWLLSLILQQGPAKTQPAMTRDECLRLIVIGAIQGVEIGLTNKALEYLSVAVRTMINSTSVLFMMATASAWGLENFGYLRGISAFLLICGGILEGYDAQDGGKTFRIFGILLQCVAMFLSAQRWALTQCVVQRSPKSSALGQMSKLQMLARVLPLTGLSCLILAVLFEPGAFNSEHLMRADLHLNVVTVAFSLVGMLWAEYSLVKLVSAVAINVISAVHQLPIVLVGVVLLHNKIGFESAIGFGFCMFGGLFYLLAHVAENSHTEEEPASVADRSLQDCFDSPEPAAVLAGA